MSLYSSVSTVRLGNLGILSVGVLAFALVSLQGCAPTMTASSAKEPGGAGMPSLGALRADAEPRASKVYQPLDRTGIEDRSPARPVRFARHGW